MTFYLEAEAPSEDCSIVYKERVIDGGEKPQSIMGFSADYLVNWNRIDSISKNKCSSF